jgi:glycosyltransferase involved in cell wall biosynthesis
MTAIANSNPIVSVVVPCRNEQDHIESVVKSILAQEPPRGGFEIIVVDGMSDDGTRAILADLARRENRLRVIDNAGRITACGFNAAIRAARGRYIALLGAHATYAPEYLKTCVEVADATGADNVGGAMSCTGEAFLQKAIALAHHSPFSVGGARWHNVGYEGWADTVFGGFYERSVFERIGLFDETLVRNQDDELNLRLTRAGGKIWHSPRIRSWYHPRASLAALFRQYLQYGYWKVRVIQKHRRPASLRHLIPAVFVVLLALLLAVGLFYAPVLWLWFGMIGLYIASDIFAAALTARRNWKFFPLLTVVFPMYHFGYGIGFLAGLLDFCIFHREPSKIFTGLTRSSTPLERT